MKIIYAGTPEFAVPPLQVLLDSPHQVVAVYTQPDRPAGRGRQLRASPVKELALAHRIPVFQPASLKQPGEQRALEALGADLMVVVAYGLLLPPAVLAAPRLGCINIHASLLPRWRGAAPIQRAIIEGDAETGVAIMQMEAGLDTGPVLREARLPITPEDTAASLHDRLSELGATTLGEILGPLEAGELRPRVQDAEGVTYARKLTKEEAELDWSRPARELARAVQGYNPWPVAYTDFNGKPLRIWRALARAENHGASPGSVLRAGAEGVDVACGEGALRLLEVQMPGKKAVAASDFANGRDLGGARLGHTP